MHIISHRRNAIEELDATPEKYGIELDLRSYGSRLVVHHEPFTDGPLFSDWLNHYKHGTLILNVKEEGLEDAVLALMREHGIEDFFFLDQSFPFLVKTARQGEPRCAVRVSEFESVETALEIARLIKWVWVDCFTKFPLSGSQCKALQNAGLKLCLVSPELQGHAAEKAIPELQALLCKESIMPEAVCTKIPDLWER